MEFEWLIDNDKDWNLYVNGEYEGLLCNRYTKDGAYRFWGYDKNELGVLDLEEAKALAVAIWAFNK